MSTLARVAFLVMGVALGSLAFATGFGGDAPPSRIPVPARDFSAVALDHGGVVVEVDRVTFAGEVFLYGKLGAAQLTLPFENIRFIEFASSSENDRRTATATTIDGSTLSLSVDDDTPWYGRTKFGNYAIEVEHLRRITFHHKTP